MGLGGGHGEYYDNRGYDGHMDREQRRLARMDVIDSRSLDRHSRGQFGFTRDWDYNDTPTRLSFPPRSVSSGGLEPYMMPPRGYDPRMNQVCHIFQDLFVHDNNFIFVILFCL